MLSATTLRCEPPAQSESSIASVERELEIKLRGNTKVGS